MVTSRRETRQQILANAFIKQKFEKLGLSSQAIDHGCVGSADLGRRSRAPKQAKSIP